jgi:Na+/phosphate symporter
MLSYKIRSWFAFFIGLILIVGGTVLIFSEEHLKENFGFLLFGIGGIFWGIMSAIQLGAQTTKEITRNVIDTLKHEGLISPYSEIRINEDLQVVKPSSSAQTVKYNVEKLVKKTAI